MSGNQGQGHASDPGPRIPVTTPVVPARMFAPEFTGEYSGEAVTLHFDMHVQSVVDHYKKASADGKIGTAELFGIVGALCECSAYVIKTFFETRTDETERGFDEIVNAAEAAFDNVVVPIDFPPGPFIEQYLEGQARMLIRPALTMLRDKIRSTPTA